MRRLQSILFYAFFALSSVPLFLIAVVVWALTTPFDRNGRILHLFSCAWAQLYFWVNPLWRLKVEGREHLPWEGGAVLVANHESLADILVLFGLFSPFKWVSKQSNFNLPLIGWNMRLNRYVPLVRGSKDSVVRMLDECEKWLARGVPVLMFPEGTRSPDGTVKAFKDGAFHLAMKARVPVVPIALAGTGRVLPKHGFVLREHANCRVRVLPPIPPEEFGDDCEALKERVRARIVEAKTSMEGGAAKPPEPTAARPRGAAQHSRAEPRPPV